MTLSPAPAAGSCTTADGTTTCAFGPTGAEDTFEVPSGVSSVRVVATGAPGAVGYGGSAAGRGAEVSGELPVTPGQTLYVEVGAAPTGGGCLGSVACKGRFNGGGSSYYGGGGASDVREEARDQSGSSGSRLIVAGGGLDALCHNEPLPGGAGGDAARKAATVRRAVRSPGAPAGARAARTPAAPGAVPAARAGRWGWAAMAEVTAVAAACTAAVAILPPQTQILRQRGEAAAPTRCRPAATRPSPTAARRSPSATPRRRTRRRWQWTTQPRPPT